TQPQSHPAVIDEIFAEPVEFVIVAFGVLGDAEQAWQDHAAAVRLAQTNYVGSVSVGVLVGQAMAAQGDGTIIAVSSVAGERVRRSNFVYGSSKAGMDGFFLQLGVALRPAGVRVLVVRPGAVRTRMTAGRTIALSTTPRVVAEATLRALARGRRFVRVPGIFNLLVPIFVHLPNRIVERLKY
ncbi:MAG: SDR family NAD(P)-dependent oxidoreductase, partial [Propionibacteriaceae bacterium]|nr:SDR family NAD(P)-dependent oxidoreductase [Propionibacteriaceae bacterium]